MSAAQTFIRNNATATSVSAAYGARFRANSDAHVILEHIRACGANGCTADEVIVALDLPYNSATARMRGLKDSGLIVASGEVRKTRSGCKAQCWVAV